MPSGMEIFTAANGLLGLVALSLTKMIKTYPAVGLVRASNHI